MLIQQITSVGFKLPEEYERMVLFAATIDANEWKRYEDDTIYTTFIKRTCNTITLRGGEDEDQSNRNSNRD